MVVTNEAIERGLRERIGSVLEMGGAVLVVGVRTTNLQPVHHTHPQIVVWDSTDASIARAEVPLNCRVILVSKWIGHGLFIRLAKVAKDRQIVLVPGLQGTGTLKRLLRAAVKGGG